MELPELLGSIMDIAKELLNSEGSSLLLADKETGDLFFYVVIGEKGDVIEGEKVPKGKGIAGTVAEKLEPIIVNDVKNDPRHFNVIDKISNFMTRNILCVPMMVMGEFVGVLEIVNTLNRDNFDDWDLKKAKYIAGQAAVAINNRQLYDDLTKRIEEITSLYEVAQSISFANQNDDILSNIIVSLAKSMQVDKASIILFNNESKNLELAASYGLPENIKIRHNVEMENSISGHIYQSGDPMIVSNAGSEIPDAFVAKDRNYKTDAFISIPIMYQKNTIGILSLTDKKNRRNFDSFDLRVLSTVSSQIAEVYQNIKNQKNIESQKRLSREIDIAAEIQRKILPKIPPRFKNHFLSALNKPAKEIGGDFFDYFKFDENKYAVLVADVSGKGIPSALFMGTARNVVRAETRINTSPAHMLKNANSFIYEDSESGMFVTLFYAVIDSHNNLITYCNAGHNPQLLIKKDKKEVLRLEASGKALGVLDDQEYEERVILYEPGDLLLLFTDGVLEYFGGDDLDIDKGEEILIKMANEYLKKDPQELVDNLNEYVNNNSMNDDFRDDFTVFAIKF